MDRIVPEYSKGRINRAGWALANSDLDPALSGDPRRSSRAEQLAQRPQLSAE